MQRKLQRGRGRARNILCAVSLGVLAPGVGCSTPQPAAPPAEAKEPVPRPADSPSAGPAQPGRDAAAAVEAASPEWLAAGLTESDVDALRAVAEPTLRALMAQDYAAYRALQQRQGATLNDAARRYVARELNSGRYGNLDAVRSRPLDEQVAFLWAHARERGADWADPVVGSVRAGLGNTPPASAPDEYVLGQGSLFSIPEEARLQAEYRSGKAEAAWIEILVRIGGQPHHTTVRLVFCQDSQAGIWVPIWIFATPRDGTTVRLMF